MEIYISENELGIANLIEKEIRKKYIYNRNDLILPKIDIFILGSSKIDDKLSSFIKKIRCIAPSSKIIVIGLGNEEALYLINKGVCPDGFIDRQSTKQVIAKSFHSLLDKFF